MASYMQSIQILFKGRIYRTYNVMSLLKKYLRMFKPAYMRARDHSSNHFDELKNSDTCGCFYCLSIFPPTEIESWVDDGKSALCPKCGIDTVIGSASGYPITKDFLEKMCGYWFPGAS